MFFHNFKYTLKTLFKNKMLIFWTFAFPIILGTFFNLAFSDIENSEKLDIINIAIVQNENFENNEIWRETFKALSDEANEDRLFATSYVKEEEAKNLLNNHEITGYIIIEDTPKVVVATSGINETVLKYVTEEIIQTTEIIENLTTTEVQKELTNGNPIDYEVLYENVLERVNQEVSSIEDVSSNHLSYTMIEFYTLIAMTCLYGGILGMTAINQCLANMSHKGKRVAVSPTSKGKLIVSSVLASYITQLIGIALLFVYTIFVLHVDYGNHLLLTILLALTGCLAGLSLGIVISTLCKANENIKIGIIISITMLGCFLSGMMGITMKYIIDKNIPILNKINPASMITDGFYSLYYYETLDRYYFNIISLLIFAFLMILLSVLSLRRQKYDSI